MTEHRFVKFLLRPETTPEQFSQALKKVGLEVFDWEGRKIFDNLEVDGSPKSGHYAYAYDEAGKQKVYNSTSGNLDELVTETVEV